MLHLVIITAALIMICAALIWIPARLIGWATAALVALLLAIDTDEET